MVKSKLLNAIFGLLLVAGVMAILPTPSAFAAQCSHYPNSGWLYLYQRVNYDVFPNEGGRCLQFSSGGVQNLTNWDFNDRLSSYRNKTAYTVYLYRDTNPSRSTLRLTVPSGQSRASMPSGWNDQVSAICIKRPSTACP